MTETNELQTASNGCECWVIEEKPYIGIHTPGGPYEYNPACPRHGDPDAPDVVADPAPERTYTREDMARAWRDGHWAGVHDDQSAKDEAPETPNPYGREDA